MTAFNLITGGAGFIGSHLAYRLLESRERVILLDNLSCPNAQHNLAWLRRHFGSRAELRLGDVRDEETVREAVNRVDNVFHLAAPLDAAASRAHPMLDFDVNARGTLNVLEALRQRKQPAALFLASTKEVYGNLNGVPLRPTERGYQPRDEAIATYGVDEDTPLEFVTPFGCSKGCADQYALEYARSYGLRCVVFRMSCVYGPRQLGAEDQGWVAHFMERALRGQALSVPGDGQQTRDLLFVRDMIDALLRARSAIERCAGHAFNVGGGQGNAVSVLEALRRICGMVNAPVLPQFDRRTLQQRYFVADHRKLSRLTGWRPLVSVDEGLARLREWTAAGVSATERPMALAPALRMEAHT